MDLKAIKQFSSPSFGNVSSGQPLIDVPKNLAKQLIEFGMAEEVDKTPLSSSGKDGKQSSLSQAGQVSQKSKQTTSNKSKKKKPAK